jgi:Ca2+-binding EF-hand superfamily protein
MEKWMFKRLIALVSIVALPVPVAAQATKAAQAARAPQGQPIPRTTFLANMDIEFKKMDSDRDGQLSRKEIETYQASQIIAAAEARKRALFVALDTDHNGVLSPAEFLRLPGNEQAPNAGPMIARFDVNRDSKVSLIEYRAGTLFNFDRLDADKDGVVTPAEMSAAGIRPH